MIKAVERITAIRSLMDDRKNTYTIYIHDGKDYRHQSQSSLAELEQAALLANAIREGKRSKDFILVSSPDIGIGKIWCNGKCWEYRYNGDADVYYVMGRQYDHYGETFEMIRNGTLEHDGDDRLEGLNEPI